MAVFVDKRLENQIYLRPVMRNNDGLPTRITAIALPILKNLKEITPPHNLNVLFYFNIYELLIIVGLELWLSSSIKY
ncbi:hypothetical protein CWN81_22840 [Vibrio splendidus]|nr:hypothetical protein CWN81_22840 [Vibrio splendidus]